MKRNTFNMYFFIKKGKLLRNGEAPVYIRLTVNGISTEFGIKRSIVSGQWLTKKGYTSGKTLKGKEINNFIDHIRYKIYDIQKKLEDQNQPVTAKLITEIYHGKKNEEKTLIPAFNYHNDRFQQLVGKECTEGSLQIYKTTLKHIREFLIAEYKTTDIPLHNVDFKFIRDFEFYLKAKKNIGHNTTVKYIKNLGKILRICISNKWMQENPLEKISLKKYLSIRLI